RCAECLRSTSMNPRAWLILVGLSSVVACGEHAQIAAHRVIAQPPRTMAASPRPPSRRAHFEARIVRFMPNALWDHYADHSFEVFDAAEIEIEQPENVRGRRVSIHHAAGTTAER